MKVNQIYNWLVSLFEISQIISELQLRKELEAEDVEHALLLLNYLVSKNLVSIKVSGASKEFVVIDIDKIKELIHYKEKETTIRKPIVIEDSLVVNVPLSLTSEFENIKSKYTNLKIIMMRDAFKHLFVSSEKEVLLSLPFFEFDGMAHFIDELGDLAKRGVSMYILSRGLLTPEREGYGYLNKLRAFTKLITIFENNKKSPSTRLEIRDYSYRISDPSMLSLLYEGIHQKMIIVDRQYAYVGSGEIRAASFLINGDAGVIQTGERAKFWGEYFDLFWKEAQIVPHEFFKSSISNHFR